ncbi:MAG: FRG domain-containing protein [Chloroflexota bacterium]|nr:FRG domain-containing protein [Chloroflexota bacterium]MDQ5865290.1 FRG domain-containing protein [Chloroflexota bacterium]
MLDEIVQPQVDCSTATDFFEAISPWGPYFGKTPVTEQWLFRGMGKDYELVPSIFRKDREGRYQLPTRLDVSAYGLLHFAEWDILVRFFEVADRRGLILPDDSQELRSILQTVRSESGKRTIVEGHDDGRAILRALSLAALAQHYGVPTRLLDWTRLPLVAAFFAANRAVHRVDEGDAEGPLVVWAFHFPEIGKQEHVLLLTHPITIVTAPSATNANLRAQQGVFTLLSPHYTEEEGGTYLPMDQVLQKEHVALQIPGTKLRKFTLPTREASELLRLLAKLDITPSAIFPGYGSIIEDLRMQARWE